MNQQDEDLLHENEWTVECESPLEIRHEDGSFASGQAAEMVIWFLKDDQAWDRTLEEEHDDE